MELVGTTDTSHSVSMDHLPTDKFLTRPFRISTLRAITDKWQTFMLAHRGWNALYLENHDQGRSVSRFASDCTPRHRMLGAKMLATFLALQSGTVFVYQGQELGMCNLPAACAGDPERWCRDLETLNHWRRIKQENPGDSPAERKWREEALKGYHLVGRDNARTPMQWDASPHAGFCPTKLNPGVAGPWIDVHPDFAEWNAEASMRDGGSVFWYWRDLLALRKEERDVFVYGGFEMLGLHPGGDDSREEEGEEDKVVAYVRTSEDGERRALVVTNFGDGEVEWVVPDARPEVQKLVRAGDRVVMHSYPDRPRVQEDGDRVVLHLRPFEACVLMD